MASCGGEIQEIFYFILMASLTQRLKFTIFFLCVGVSGCYYSAVLPSFAFNFENNKT